LPGIDSAQGFFLLLLIPLLFILQRWRYQTRNIILTTYPLLVRIHSDIIKKPPVFFRLRRKYRQVLITVFILLMALIYNGAYFQYRQPVPGGYLLVIDNTFTLGPGSAEKNFRSLVERAIEQTVGLLAHGDTLTVIVTGPDPRIAAVLSEGSEQTVPSLTPSESVPDVEELIEFIESLAVDMSLKEIFVISPRSDQWRTEISVVPEPNIYNIPQDLEILQGNAGIVAFDLRPSLEKPDSFDLYFRVNTFGLEPPPEKVVMKTGDGTSRIITLNWNGTDMAEYISRDLDLPPGNVTLSLDIKDALSADNRIVAQVEVPDQIHFRLYGEQHPLLEKAISSYPGFQRQGKKTVFEKIPVVNLYFGSPPTDKLTGPSLIIMPDEDFLDIQYLRYWENPGNTLFHPTHPMTRNLAFRNFQLEQIFEFLLPSDFMILGRSGHVPFMFAGERDGHRMVVWSFNPFDGGIFLEPSFIILLQESIKWVGGGTEVFWSTLAGCGNGSDALGQRRIVDSGSINILCPKITEAGANINIPDLSRLKLSQDRERHVRRRDLSPFLLAVSCLILLYLAVVNAYASGVSE
jgi:hypothetical protein